MNPNHRMLLYLLVCLPVRTIPIITLFLTRKVDLPISILYLFMGISFLYRTTTFHTGQLGAFGGKVWWQNLRYIHGMIYLLAFWLIYKKRIQQVKCLLIADLLVGLVGFINHYLLN